jgi:AcrR family transcriptional regulator
MSPYPAQTDREAIIRAGCALVERKGVEGLTLAGVASELGIKSPSLYRYFASKAALIQAIIEHTFQEMFAAYEAALAGVGDDPEERLLNLFRAHRAFAHVHPHTYVLAYTATAPELRADPAMLEQLVIPIQRIMAEVSGEAGSLPALRGALALVHGFVMLELNDQLRRGGDLGAAFEASIQAYLRGWNK